MERLLERIKGCGSRKGGQICRRDPTKEEIEAFEIRYLKDMADRYGGQLEAEAARRRARLKEKARRAREQI